MGLIQENFENFGGTLELVVDLKIKFKTFIKFNYNYNCITTIKFSGF